MRFGMKNISILLVVIAFSGCVEDDSQDVIIINNYESAEDALRELSYIIFVSQNAYGFNPPEEWEVIVSDPQLRINVTIFIPDINIAIFHMEL